MFNVAVLKEMWMHGWPVISLLIICSILSFAVMLERWSYLSGVDFDRDVLLERLRKFLSERKKDQAIGFAKTHRPPIGRILATLMDPPAIDKTAGPEHLDRLALRLIRAESVKMMHNLTLLGTIGSIAPYVGLFGTVIGIIRAFRAIAENSGGGPGVVATGIAEALVTAALGLFVAIPAVVAYNALARRADRINDDMELAAEEIIDLSAK